MDKTKTIQISDIGEVITGNTPPRKNPEYYGDYTLFIKPTDISKDSKYTYNPEECYSEIGYEKYKKTLIPQGATCVVTIGSIGEKLTKAHTDCFINQAMNAVIPNEKYDEDYVYYVLKYNLKQLKMFDSGTASGRENVSKSAFSSININVLTKKDNQIKVGKILSNYDDLIENNNKRIKILEEIAQKIYKEWFVDFKFPGYETTTFKQTDLGKIPNNWEIKQIGKEYKTYLGGTPSRNEEKYWNGKIPWLNSGKTNELRITKASEYVTELGLEKSSTKLMPQYTTVLAITGATLGQVSMLGSEMCANQSVVGIYSDKNPEYVFYLMKDKIQKLIQSASGGAQQHINKDIVNEMKFVLPADTMLNDFKNIIRPINKEIFNLLYKNHTLKQMRDLLLPRLISGEIDVEKLEIL